MVIFNSYVKLPEGIGMDSWFPPKLWSHLGFGGPWGPWGHPRTCSDARRRWGTAAAPASAARRPPHDAWDDSETTRRRLGISSENPKDNPYRYSLYIYIYPYLYIIYIQYIYIIIYNETWYKMVSLFMIFVSHIRCLNIHSLDNHDMSCDTVQLRTRKSPSQWHENSHVDPSSHILSPNKNGIFPWKPWDFTAFPMGFWHSHGIRGIPIFPWKFPMGFLRDPISEANSPRCSFSSVCVRSKASFSQALRSASLSARSSSSGDLFRAAEQWGNQPGSLA